MDNLIALALSIPLGTASSIAAWWIVLHGFHPDIEWAPRIRTVPGPSGRVRRGYCTVSFRNVGRRSATDVAVHARVRLKGLVPNRPARWLVFTIPVNQKTIPIVRPFPKAKVSHAMVLEHWGADPADLARLPKRLRVGLPKGTTTLIDLLGAATEAELVIGITCSDSFSGGRYSFERTYRVGDFQEVVDSRLRQQFSALGNRQPNRRSGQLVDGHAQPSEQPRLTLLTIGSDGLLR